MSSSARDVLDAEVGLAATSGRVTGQEILDALARAGYAVLRREAIEAVLERGGDCPLPSCDYCANHRRLREELATAEPQERIRPISPGYETKNP